MSYDVIEGVQRENVLDVTERRPHHVRRNSENILDDLLGPPKFGDDLLVRQAGERWVTPGVHSDVMPGHKLRLEGGRERDDTGSDNEEG